MAKIENVMNYKSKEDAIIFPYIKSLYTSGKIIDIGCKSGKWALYLKDTIPEENWIMFDAISKFIKDLSRFYKKSELHSLALSDVNEDKRKFVIDKKHMGHSSFTHNGRSNLEIRYIKSRKLDDFNYNDIWLIKIDTEGHELPVLRGAKETILRNNPILYFECYHKIMNLQDYNQKDIYDYITGLDYNITNIKTNKVLNYEEFNLQTLSDKTTLHNFIARKK